MMIKSMLFYKDDGVVLRKVSSQGLLGLKQISLFSKAHNPCLCGENSDLLISAKDRYAIPLDYKICSFCGLVRIDPYYSDSDLEIIYRDYYRDIKSKTKEETFDFQKEKGRAIYNFLQKMKLPFSKVLEIGTGAGGILASFKEHGVDVVGVDFDKDYIEFGKKYGLNLFIGDGISFLDNEAVKNVDLIILNHVLEHIKNPRFFLQQLVEKMPQNAVLYLSFPGLRKFPNRESPNCLSKCFAFVHPWWFDLNSFFYNVLRGLKIEVLYADELIRVVLKKSPNEFTHTNSPKTMYTIMNFIYLRAREVGYNFIKRWQ